MIELPIGVSHPPHGLGTGSTVAGGYLIHILGNFNTLALASTVQQVYSTVSTVGSKRSDHQLSQALLLPTLSHTLSVEGFIYYIYFPTTNLLLHHHLTLSPSPPHTLLILHTSTKTYIRLLRSLVSGMGKYISRAL